MRRVIWVHHCEVTVDVCAACDRRLWRWWNPHCMCWLLLSYGFHGNIFHCFSFIFFLTSYFHYIHLLVCSLFLMTSDSGDRVDRSTEPLTKGMRALPVTVTTTEVNPITDTVLRSETVDWVVVGYKSKFADRFDVCRSNAMFFDGRNANIYDWRGIVRETDLGDRTFARVWCSFVVPGSLILSVRLSCRGVPTKMRVTMCFARSTCSSTLEL